MIFVRLVSLFTLLIGVLLMAQSHPITRSNRQSAELSGTQSGATAALDGNALSRLSVFQQAIAFSSGGPIAASVAVADIDGDGHQDLVVANQNGSNHGTVGILFNHGGDTVFDSPVLYDSGGPDPWSIAIADLNADGKPDIVVANSNLTNNVGVLINKGDGTFWPVVTYALSGVPTVSVVIADVNGDGKPDLITNGVEVLLGKGDGTFKPAKQYGAGAGSSVAVADVNGDGKMDVIVAVNNGTSTGVGVFLGKGDGTFNTEVSYPSGGFQVSAVAVGDLNGDGKPDIVVANYCADQACNRNGSVGVLLGNGDGTFQPAVTYDADARYPQSLAIADVDQDGHVDVMVGTLCAAPSRVNCGTHGSVSILYGNGDGTFQPDYFFLTPGPAMSLAFADVNGGNPDLTVASSGSGIGILTGARVSTTTSLISSQNPSVVDQSVTFTATVTASSGQIPDGRTVIFSDGTTEIGTGATINGVATFTTSSLAAGRHSIKAYFPIARAFRPSGHLVSQVVKP